MYGEIRPPCMATGDQRSISYYYSIHNAMYILHVSTLDMYLKKKLNIKQNKTDNNNIIHITTSNNYVIM